MIMDLAALKHFSSKKFIEHCVNPLCISVNTASKDKKAVGKTYNSLPASWGKELYMYL